MATTAPREAGPIESLRTAAVAGEFQQALDIGYAHLRGVPQDPDAHRHLGQIHAWKGDRLLGLRHATRACELAPDDPRCWSDLGRVHALADDLKNAERCFRQALTVDSRHADGWHNLGVALRKRRDREGSFAALKRALVVDSTRADTYLELGNLLIESGQFEDAIECFERAARHDPTLARARSRLAQYLSAHGKVKRAESLYRQSLGLDPNHVQGWFGLGRALEDLGQADAALSCYLNVFQRRPDHALAIGQYLALVRGDPDPRIECAANTAMNREDTNDEAKAAIGYALAKFYDRRGRFEQAAAAGCTANEARRRVAGPLDRGALAANIDRLISACTRDFFAARRRWGLGIDQPVFIVGLPRSGTTLTEQILSSHPLFHGAGELPDIARIASRCAGADDWPWQAVTRIDEAQCRQRAHEYLRALRDGAPMHRLRIIDKSPLNVFHLALIAVLFPSARVIHCKRDARDNALSIWMENFNAAQRYATDFDDLSFFIGQYRRLTDHWREHVPLETLEVNYEDTVADVERQARRIVAFLGAPWEECCLHFHDSGRAVQTPSRWQVRKPIYNSSVGRWNRYATWLPELSTLAR